MLDTTTAIRKAEQYAEEVTKILNPKAIVLYGSYAKGTAKSNSDIDIAVILDDFTGDFIEVSKILYKLRRNISADIEPILLDSAHDKSGFVAEVMKTGRLLGTNLILRG